MQVVCRDCGKELVQKRRGRKRFSCSDLCKNRFNLRERKQQSAKEENA